MKRVLDLLLVLLVTALFGCYYLVPPIRYYNIFYLQNYDYGVLYQSTALLSRGEPAFLWNIGRYTWADNQDYFQVLLSVLHHFPEPHYWLLTFHSVAIFSVGLLWLLIFKGDLIVAICGAVFVWLSPQMTNMNTDLFHTEAFATLFLVAAFCFAQSGKGVCYLLLALLALSCKEDVAVTVIMLALLQLTDPGLRVRKFWCGAVLLMATALLVCNLFIVVPHFAALSCKVLGFDDVYPVARPLAPWFRKFFDEGASVYFYADVIYRYEIIIYLAVLLWPLLLLGRWSRYCLLPIPAIAINLIASSRYLIEMLYHYDHSTFAAVLIALVATLPHVSHVRRRAVGLAVGAMSVQLLQPVQFREPFYYMFMRDFWELDKAPIVRELESLSQKLPKDLSISADYTSANYLLLGRNKVWMYENPFSSHYFGVYNHCDYPSIPQRPDIVVIKNDYKSKIPEANLVTSDYRPCGISNNFSVYINIHKPELTSLLECPTDVVGDGSGGVRTVN